MDFFDAVNARRSIRRYANDIIPTDVMKKAFEAAILAPNSSNVQTWDFYWVKSQDKKSELIKACLSQSAARTAQELVVIVADPKLWKRSQGPLVKYTQEINAPKQVQLYYSKLVPIMYSWGFLNLLAPLKHIASFITGIFRPITRGPFTKSEIQTVCIKSAALAAENFVLAIAAQGYSTCMMEGFDEWRIKSLLKLSFTSRVVMVISVGKETENGTWGPRFRLPYNKVVHEV